MNLYENRIRNTHLLYFPQRIHLKSGTKMPYELFPCLPSGQLTAVSIASGVPNRWSPFYFNDKLVCIKLAIVNCSIKFFAKQVPRNNWPGGVAVQGRDSTNPAVRHAVELPLTGNCVSLTHRPVTMPTGVSRLVVKEG